MDGYKTPLTWGRLCLAACHGEVLSVHCQSAPGERGFVLSTDQVALFEDFADNAPEPSWANHITTLSFDETALIQAIIKLHNAGRPFDVDPTYSTGRFWQGLPQPLQRFDIAPQTADTLQADARALPLADSSVDSIMFDPPFVVAPSPAPGIIRDRFSCYKDIAELWAFYRAALVEFTRILCANGIICFKCQDTVSGGVNYMTHAAVIVMAQQIGLYVKDLFILGRTNVLWSPNMANQQHARKNHSYFLILQKTDKSRLLRLSSVLTI